MNNYVNTIQGVPVTEAEEAKFNSFQDGKLAQEFIDNLKKENRQGEVLPENQAPAVKSTSTMSESNLTNEDWEKPLAQANKAQAKEDTSFNKATGSNVDNQQNFVGKSENLNLTAEQYWGPNGPSITDILNDAEKEHLGVNQLKDYLNTLYAGHDDKSPYTAGTLANNILKNHPFYKKILDHYEEVIKEEEALRLDTTKVREEAESMGVNTDNIPSSSNNAKKEEEKIVEKKETGAKPTETTETETGNEYTPGSPETVEEQVKETGLNDKTGNYREEDEANIKANKEMLKRRKELFKKQENGYLSKSEAAELDELNRKVDAIKTGNDYHGFDEEDINAIYDKGTSIDDMMRNYREGSILHARDKELKKNNYKANAISSTISSIESTLKNNKDLSPEDRAKLEDDLDQAKKDLDATKDEAADIKNHYGRFIFDAIEKAIGGLSTWGDRGKKANKQQSEWDKLVETNLMAEANRHNKARDASTQAAINALMTDADMTADNLKSLNALKVNDRALEQARKAGALESWSQYNAYVNQIADLFDPKNGYNSTVVAGVLKSKFGFSPLEAVEFLAANGIEAKLNEME